MATQQNDLLIVQRGTISGAGGDDTYILSASNVDANAQIIITDTQGANRLQLIGGLSIVSSIVASNTAQLTLSNGAIITIMSASNFTYEIGGNPLFGQPGTSQTYAEFASDTLGTTVPVSGTNTGGAVTIPDGSVNPTLVAGAASVNEGQSATFALAHASANTTYSYEITGVEAADITGGSLSGTVTTDANGAATISVSTVADRMTEGAQTIKVSLPNSSLAATTVLNDTSLDNTAPVITAATPIVVNEADAAVNGKLVANDPEGDAITFAQTSAIPGLTINADGTYTFNPADNPAAQALTYKSADLALAATYTATDALGLAATGTLSITVKPTPLSFTLTPVNMDVEEGFAQTYAVTASEAVAEDTVVNFLVLPAGDGTVSGETGPADFNQGQLNPTAVTITKGQTKAEYIVEPTNDGNTEVPEAFQVQAKVNGETLLVDANVLDSTDPALIGKTFYYTNTVDVFTPTASGSSKTTIGNDTFHGTIGNETLAGVIIESRTLTNTDITDGGAGLNILNVTDITKIDDGKGTVTTPGSNLTNMNLTNIQTVNHSSVGDVLADLTVGFKGVTAYNVIEGANVDVLAADTTAISVSGVIGNIIVDGGSTQTVTTEAVDTDITLGATTGAVGAIKVTHNNQGDGNILIDGGTTVDLISTVTNKTADAVASGAIVIGATTEPTGAVNVTQNLVSNGRNTLAGSPISVEGGTTVDITVNATSVATDVDYDSPIIILPITVTGNGDTTAVNVVQNSAVTTKTDAGVAAVMATEVVTFDEMTKGDTITVNGLTFTAYEDLTAEEAAAAFSNLTANDTQSAGGPVANGVYTNAFTAVPGWTSGAVSGKTVTFTGPAFDSVALVLAGSAAAPTGVLTAGTAAIASDTSTNFVVNGPVTIDDTGSVDAIKSISVDGYLAADIGGGGSADALTKLSLSNGANATVISATTALGLTLDNVFGPLDFSACATLSTLNITTTGGESITPVSAASVTALTIAAGADLILTGSTFTAAETVVITGSGDVVMDVVGLVDGTITSIDASGATGDLVASIDAADCVFKGTKGDNYLTLNSVNVDETITFNDGDDTLDLSVGAAGILAGDITKAINGSGGVDTLVMSSADAALNSASAAFAAVVTGFERLAIADNVAADTTIDLAALGNYNYVIAEDGTTAATLTLNKLSTNGALAVGDSGDYVVNITNAKTGTADVLNLIAGGGTNNITADDVETVNVSFDGSADLFIDATAATTITVSGTAAGSALGVVGNNKITTINASATTGGIDVDAAGSVACTITGGSGNDALAASGYDIGGGLGIAGQDITGVVHAADILIGGAGNDTLYANDMLTKMTGGTGNDTFVISMASLQTNSPATIMDAAAGDLIQFAGAINFVSLEVTLDPAGNPALVDYADAAINMLAANELGWFEYGSNTYVVMDVANSAAFVQGTDMIVKLVGSHDLSTASYNVTANTLEIG